MKLALLLAVGIVCAGAEVKLGQPVEVKNPFAVSELLQKTAEFEGKTVQVRGKVTEVCQMMGCWVNLVDTKTGDSIRIKVVDGEIIFPADSPGRTAVAEGKLKKIVLSKEQAIAAAKHEAEEQGRKFNPDSVQAGKTIFQIQGTGAVLLD